MAFIDVSALETTEFRSDRLGRMATMACRLQEPGRYSGELWRGEIRLREFVIDLEGGGTGEELTLDLWELERNERKQAGYAAAVHEEIGIYVQFFCSAGPGGYHVILRQDGQRESRFDSRRLNSQDVYFVLAAMPGTYAIRNEADGAEARLQVSRAKPRERAAPPELGAQFRVQKGKMDPSRAQVESGDGTLFFVEAPATIVVEQVESGEKAKEPVRRRITNPRSHPLDGAPDRPKKRLPPAPRTRR